jgi:hypothetical protein
VTPTSPAPESYVAPLHWGGYLGLVTAALAGYPGAAGICEYSYGQPVLPV